MTDISASDTRSASYVLGHSDRELDRLSAQARLIDPITRRFLQEAGVGPGMRVLDVGSGAGDVAFLAAELVGQRGEVVGVDRSPVALEVAGERARALSLDNVTFREGDPAEMTFDRSFDAVIGRYVLQFQHDPSAMLRRVAAHARPGGVIVFHELDWDGVRSFPPSPTLDRYRAWSAATLQLSGAELHMGMKLFATFLAAGLPAPSMRLEALAGGGEHSWDALQLLIDLIGTLAPAMERLGVATADEIGYGTLGERLREEMLAGASVMVGHLQIGCWSTTPSAQSRD